MDRRSASGAYQSFVLGTTNPLTPTYGYDHRNRLSSIDVGSIQDLTLTYDEASNVKTVTDGTGTPETVTYSYDQLNRLTGATGFSDGSSASYSYNSIGNLLSKQEGTSSFTLGYPASGASSVRPHAVTSTSGSHGGQAFNRSFYYDPVGNIKGSGDGGYRYDAENRLVATLKSPAYSSGIGFFCVNVTGTSDTADVVDLQQISAQNGKNRTTPGWNYKTDLNWSGSTDVVDLQRESAGAGPCVTREETYVYDGNGTLLKRTTPAGSTVYIGGVFEKSSSGVIKKYYAAFGQTIAMREVTAGGTQGTTAYLLHDHLGSTVGALDTTGGLVSGSKTTYWPYGGTRSGGSTGTDKMYTGQQQEAGDLTLGTYNYKARFYSATLGRFVSSDSLVQDRSDPQTLNRYTYVRNAPLSFVDPSGRCFEWAGAMLDCSRNTLLNWYSCAWGGNCASDGLRSMARTAIKLPTFRFMAELERQKTGDLRTYLYAGGRIDDVIRHFDGLPGVNAIEAGTISFWAYFNISTMTIERRGWS